jgi:hypothetical protein
MKQVVFAKFSSSEAADAAIAELAAAAPATVAEAVGGAVQVFKHRPAESPGQLAEAVQHSDNIAATDARHGVVAGLVTGGLVGAALGAAAGWFDLVPVNALAAAVLGACLGGAMGVLASGMIGAGLPDRSLARLTRDLQPSDVVITVEAPDRQARRQVINILRNRGGRVAVKRAV